jgi:hypothetical protein
MVTAISVKHTRHVAYVAVIARLESYSFKESFVVGRRNRLADMCAAHIYEIHSLTRENEHCLIVI